MRHAPVVIAITRPVMFKSAKAITWLDAGQSAAQPGDPGADEDRPEPERHARVEAAIEEIEGERAWRDEEDPDPDRPVRDAIADLVVFADRTIACELDPLGVAERAFVRGGQNAAPQTARLFFIRRSRSHRQHYYPS